MNILTYSLEFGDHSAKMAVIEKLASIKKKLIFGAKFGDESPKVVTLATLLATFDIDHNRQPFITLLEYNTENMVFIGDKGADSVGAPGLKQGRLKHPLGSSAHRKIMWMRNTHIISPPLILEHPQEFCIVAPNTNKGVQIKVKAK